MRSIPSYISERLNRNVQTTRNTSDPSTRMWISRPTTVLTNDAFLERQTVVNSAITDVSIAVCHPRAMRSNTQICMGYISSGVARAATAKHKTNMDDHIWIDSGFEEPATAISVAYDGTMPKANNGDVEFVTESYPWVLWVNNSVLYGRKLYSDEDAVVLAETNCTDVSAIRAMHSTVGGFDFGLVVFFILNGQLFYRQLINGEWKDAEAVSFGPSGTTWKEISTFRTWDYRIGVQAKSTAGDIYELFTQFMGVGKQNVEHIEVDAEAGLSLNTIGESTVRTVEHAVNVARAESGTPYDGLYSTLPPKITDAYNVGDDSGNWGNILIVIFDTHLRAYEIARNYSAFTLSDENGMSVSPSRAELKIEDGLTVKLIFEDFNSLVGTCKISYTPGDAITLADTLMEFTEFEFVPANLNPPDISIPEAVSIWNF